MIVLLVDSAGISARPVRLLDRLTARARATRLDSQLADGAPPESSVALALHAQLLVRPSERRLLASSLRRIAAAAEPSARVRLRTPLCRDAVRCAGPEIKALADRLLSPGPVSAQGVATVRLLLADGTGPFYRACTARDLRSELCMALATLGPLI